MLNIKNIIILILLVIAMMPIAGGSLFAQSVTGENTGLTPYIDSKHAYAIQVHKGGNTTDKVWQVTDGTDTYIFSSTNNAVTATVYPWAYVHTDAVNDGDREVVEIEFLRTIFNVGETWYLQYFEYSKAGGECVSARQVAISIEQNEFYLTMADDGSECNSQSGVVHTYNEFDNNSYETTVTYNVYMNKPADFLVNQWAFDARFLSQAVTSFTATMVTANGGTVTSSPAVTGTADSIHLLISDINAAGQALTSVQIKVEVKFLNAIDTDTTHTMTIRNGQARSASSDPYVFTDDNIITYPVATPGDRSQTIAVNKLPATQDIQPGIGEDDWSANFPRQGSTHRYTVVMGTTTNFSTSGTGWQFINADGSNITPDTRYTLTRVATATPAASDSVKIAFGGDLPTGEYIIRYTETDANGCSSVRDDTIHIDDKFNVDIALEGDPNRCAGIAGVVNNSYTTATTTTVNYTVYIPDTVNYYANWSCDLGVAANPVFAADEFTVQSIETGTTGATLTGTGNSRHIAVVNTKATPVKTVNITVTYLGLYANAHEITVALTNITGSYNEVDADNVNEVKHTIHSMPQPKALAGID